MVVEVGVLSMEILSVEKVELVAVAMVVTQACLEYLELIILVAVAVAFKMLTKMVALVVKE